MKHRWLGISAASTSTAARFLGPFHGQTPTPHPAHPSTPPPPSLQPVSLPLVFTHAFPGVAMSPGLADGNVPAFCVFIGRGCTWEKKPGILCGPPPQPPQPLNHLACVTPSAPDMRGNNNDRKMGLDLCGLVSWEELKSEVTKRPHGREHAEDSRCWHPLHFEFTNCYSIWQTWHFLSMKEEWIYQFAKWTIPSNSLCTDKKISECKKTRAYFYD